MNPKSGRASEVIVQGEQRDANDEGKKERTNRYSYSPAD